ncbi:hypothetical protein [Microcoleus sp. FACHB-1515]|uniref:hypothetical protein n=1 Tax=Microcoleus sp. FACHB-1515 TaxID=2692821 RepID=UPI001A7EE11C|nr:hypothetical protein [Microcoleus sp. FACHB-1515]
MARLLRHPGFIQPRLLIAFLVTFPTSCFVIWICLFYLAVPYLLNSARIVPTYVGFHIQYPYPSLIGAVHNLRCRTNGLVADGFSYFCRFNVKPSNVEEFARQMELSPTTSNHCIQLLSERGQQLSEPSWFLPEDWWQPLDLVGGQCYSGSHGDNVTLFYSSTGQLAYINDSDW